jgi:hypothetical protein
MRTISDVIRGEGLASALRRTRERLGEAAHHASLRMRSGNERAEILNYSATSIAPRTGGVAIQLMARLRAEQQLRDVALLHPAGLQFATHARRAVSVAEALAITGAQTIHIEGTSELPIDEVLQSGARIVISIHDLTLLHRDRAAELLAKATGVIFPSTYLREQFPALRAEIIEPAVLGANVNNEGRAIAFAGAVRRDKGAHLLPEIARGRELHVFGGGDVEVLRALRAHRNILIHGYYRAGTLPSLLAKHHVGLVLIPSIVPESYSITLTETWLAGALAAAFDLGAPAERIRNHGGGWLASVDEGASGLAQIVDRWQSGERVNVPRVTTSPELAARAHVSLYREWGLLTAGRGAAGVADSAVPPRAD